MEAIPRKYGEWGQFDRYCKLVLYHEAIDYLREMKCRRDREVSLDAVSPADWDKLSTVDRYSCDSFTFSSHGYDLHIDNELGNVPQRSTAPQDKHPKRPACKIDGVHAGERLNADETIQLQGQKPSA